MNQDKQQPSTDPKPSTNQNKKTINKLAPQSKIILSIAMAFIWLIATQGRPKKAPSIAGLTYVDTSIQQIFQTTIAIERRRFTKRIYEKSEGIWSYIPYMNQPKWVDLQIQLTTRIGFDASNPDNVKAALTPQGKLQVRFLEPSVLQKHWQTKIIDKSDSLFVKWDIREFKNKERQLLEDLAEAETLQLLDSFRSDSQKMHELSHRLEQKILIKDSMLSTPLKWLTNLNRMIDNKVHELTDNFPHQIYQTPEILEYKSNQSYSPKKQKNVQPIVKRDRASSIDINKKVDPKPFKQISYTQQQHEMRYEMKNQLNL